MIPTNRSHRSPRFRLLLTILLVCGAAHAAEPEFKPSIVTESRIYQRETGSFSIAGIGRTAATVYMSRVTIVLDDVRITGDWEPQTLRSATAKDFRRGGEVFVALDGNRLLLKHPDGSTVTTKIVKREKQKPPRPSRPRD